MGGLKLKTIPCSLVKSFPRLRWWDLRFLLYMANVLPLYCCQHIIANIFCCQYIILPIYFLLKLFALKFQRQSDYSPSSSPCLSSMLRGALYSLYLKEKHKMCMLCNMYKKNSRTSFNMNFRFSFWRTTCYLNSHLFLGLCLS